MSTIRLGWVNLGDMILREGTDIAVVCVPGAKSWGIRNTKKDYWVMRGAPGWFATSAEALEWADEHMGELKTQ